MPALPRTPRTPKFKARLSPRARASVGEDDGEKKLKKREKTTPTSPGGGVAKAGSEEREASRDTALASSAASTADSKETEEEVEDSLQERSILARQPSSPFSSSIGGGFGVGGIGGRGGKGLRVVQIVGSPRGHLPPLSSAASVGSSTVNSATKHLVMSSKGLKKKRGGRSGGSTPEGDSAEGESVIEMSFDGASTVLDALSVTSKSKFDEDGNLKSRGAALLKKGGEFGSSVKKSIEKNRPTKERLADLKSTVKKTVEKGRSTTPVKLRDLRGPTKEQLESLKKVGIKGAKASVKGGRKATAFVRARSKSLARHKGGGGGSTVGGESTVGEEMPKSFDASTKAASDMDGSNGEALTEGDMRLQPLLPDTPLPLDDGRPPIAFVNVANRSFRCLSVLSAPGDPRGGGGVKGKNNNLVTARSNAAVYEVMPEDPVRADLAHGGPAYVLKVIPMEPRLPRTKKDSGGNEDGDATAAAEDGGGNDAGTVSSISTRAFEAREGDGEDRFEIERRVRTEIAVLRSISHENVIKLLSFELGRDDRQLLERAEDEDDRSENEESGDEDTIATATASSQAVENSFGDFSAISALTIGTEASGLSIGRGYVSGTGLPGFSTVSPAVAYLLTPIQSRSLTKAVTAGGGWGPIRNPRALLHILESLSSALSAVHAAGHRHNDLTPDAVLLKYPPGYDPKAAKRDPANAPLPVVVLSSFGSVTPANVQVATKYEALRIRSYHKRRTPAAYRAPELWKVGRAAKSVADKKGVHAGKRFAPITPAADAFSLGCVMFYAMFGRHAFGRKTSGKSQPERWIATVPGKSYKRVHPFFLRASLCLMVENPDWRLTVRNLLGESLLSGKLGESEETPHLRACWMDYMGSPGLDKFKDLIDTKLDEHIRTSVKIRPLPTASVGEDGSGNSASIGNAGRGLLGPLGLPTRPKNASSSRMMNANAASLNASMNEETMMMMLPPPTPDAEGGRGMHNSFADAGPGYSPGQARNMGFSFSAADALLDSIVGERGCGGGGVGNMSINLDVSFVVKEGEEGEEEEEKGDGRSAWRGKKTTSEGFNLGQVHRKLEALLSAEEGDGTDADEATDGTEKARGAGESNENNVLKQVQAALPPPPPPSSLPPSGTSKSSKSPPKVVAEKSKEIKSVFNQEVKAKDQYASQEVSDDEGSTVCEETGTFTAADRDASHAPSTDASISSPRVWIDTHMQSAFELWNNRGAEAAGAGDIAEGGVSDIKAASARGGGGGGEGNHRSQTSGSVLPASPMWSLLSSVDGRQDQVVVKKKPEWGVFERDDSDDEDQGCKEGDSGGMPSGQEEAEPPSTVAAMAASFVASIGLGVGAGERQCRDEDDNSSGAKDIKSIPTDEKIAAMAAVEVAVDTSSSAQANEAAKRKKTRPAKSNSHRSGRMDSTTSGTGNHTPPPCVTDDADRQPPSPLKIDTNLLPTDMVNMVPIRQEFSGASPCSSPSSSTVRRKPSAKAPLTTPSRTLRKKGGKSLKKLFKRRNVKDIPFEVLAETGSGDEVEVVRMASPTSLASPTSSTSGMSSRSGYISPAETRDDLSGY